MVEKIQDVLGKKKNNLKANTRKQWGFLNDLIQQNGIEIIFCTIYIIILIKISEVSTGRHFVPFLSLWSEVLFSLDLAPGKDY